MKIFFLLLCLMYISGSNAQDLKISQKPDPTKKTMIVDTACGECQFKMKGDDCDLAVRINGKTYFVDGTDIDSHGDAHAKDGFCNAIRKAEVQGNVVDNRFRVTYFKLLHPKTKILSKDE